MGFHMISGLMGGGKTYMGVELMYQCLSEGGVVHTNIQLDGDTAAEKGWAERIVYLGADPSTWVRCRQEPSKSGGFQKVWESDVLQMGREGAENLVVIDETALLYDAQSQLKRQDENAPMFGLVALSRHAGLDIYFLAQKTQHVAKRVRDLAETETWCVNSSKLPVIGWLLKLLYGDLRRQVYRDGEEWGRYYLRINPEIGRFYKTDQMRENLELKQGGNRVKGQSAWTKNGLWKIAGGAFFAVALFSLSIWYMFNQWGNMGDSAKEVTAEAPKTEKKVVKDQNGNSKEVERLARPEPPKGGVTLLEWHPYDEHIFGYSLNIAGKKVIGTRGGRKLFVGGSYEGARIAISFQSGDWYYFETEGKRLIVVRPIRPEERQYLPPLTIKERESRQGEIKPVNQKEVLDQFPL